MNVRAMLEQQLGSAYRIERELGGGGMSHVFLAEVTALGRYGDFVELWKDADAALQPNVTTVRERITKLLRKTG